MAHHRQRSLPPSNPLYQEPEQSEAGEVPPLNRRTAGQRKQQMKQQIIQSLMVNELSQSSHSISDEEAVFETSLQTILNEHSRIEETSVVGDSPDVVTQ